MNTANASAPSSTPRVEDDAGPIIVTLDHHGRILACGGRAEALFGRSRAALCGRPITQFLGGADGGASPSFHARYLAYLCSGRGRHTLEPAANPGPGKVELKFSRCPIGGGRDVILVKMNVLPS